MGKFKQIYLEEGLSSLIKRTFHKLRRFLFTFNQARWLVCNLSEAVSQNPESEKSDIQVSFYHDLDIPAKWLASLNEVWMLDPREYAIAKEAQHVWALITVNGENAGYLKIGFAKSFVIDFARVVEFPPSWAFIYDTYIIPAKRGQGLGKMLVAAALPYLRSKNYQFVCCHIPYWNTASYKLFASLDFQYRCRIWFLKFFGIPYLSSNPAKFYYP